MSTSAGRRRRLAFARTLPQAHCEHCGTSMARVDDPMRHLQRCARFAQEAADLYQVPLRMISGRPSLWRRLLGVVRSLGIPTRGAAE